MRGSMYKCRMLYLHDEKARRHRTQTEPVERRWLRTEPVERRWLSSPICRRFKKKARSANRACQRIGWVRHVCALRTQRRAMLQTIQRHFSSEKEDWLSPSRAPRTQRRAITEKHEDDHGVWADENRYNFRAKSVITACICIFMDRKYAVALAMWNIHRLEKNSWGGKSRQKRYVQSPDFTDFVLLSYMTIQVCKLLVLHIRLWLQWT